MRTVLEEEDFHSVEVDIGHISGVAVVTCLITVADAIGVADTVESNVTKRRMGFCTNAYKVMWKESYIKSMALEINRLDLFFTVVCL